MADRQVNRDRKPWIEVAAFAGIMGIGAVVLLQPGVAYAPAPKALLFLIVGVMTAIACGRQVAAKVQLNVGWLVATYTGTTAAAIGLAWMLDTLAQPEQQIAVYHVYTKNGEGYPLDADGAVEVKATSHGLSGSQFVDGNTLVLIFPEQAPELDVGIRFPPGIGPRYWGKLTYAGPRSTDLVVGKDLVLRGSTP